MKSSMGTCTSCLQNLPVNKMAKHLQQCNQIRRKNAKGQLFLIKATARHNPFYWIFIEADCSCTLGELDAILCDVWVECCGHLSSFTVDGKEYPSDSDSLFGEKHNTMKARLDRLLTVGKSFVYEYDFGTTTELVLKVVSRYDGRFEGSTRVLARNDPPQLKCVECGVDASVVCCICHFDEGTSDGILCDKCVKEHECGDEMALMLVNSPRTGMCGYEG